MRRLSSALGAALLLAALPSVSSAQTRRVAHTATLLATGDVLIAGGVDETGAVLATAELVATSRGPQVVSVGGMGVARASHTATMMASGCVLVAGGNTGPEAGPAVATNDVRVYNPATSAWTAPGNMTTSRFNHTATLLNSGVVLVCGGQDAAGNALTGCERYTPTAGSCTVGTWSAAASLLQARYNHTAVLLKDGRVWFAGGRNPAIVATGGYLTTTERYDPVGNVFQSAAPMIEARSNHTATLMGDGKGLVVGGFNQRDVLANKGITNSTEIYDPIGNSVTPAASLLARRQSHGTTLSADGTVTVFGGLGNITTTFVDVSAEVRAGGTVSFGAPVAVPTATITGVSAEIALDFLLSKSVVGVIQDGEILMSSAAIVRPWGIIRFRPGNEGGIGTRINLAGQIVGCREDFPPITGNCGNVQTAIGTGAALLDSNPGGQATFYPRAAVSNTNNATVSAGQIQFAPSPLDDSNLTATLNPAGSFFTTTIRIPMDNDFIGHTVSGVFNLTDGSLVQSAGTDTAFTVTITSGGGVVPPTVVAADASGNGIATFTIPFTAVEGTVAYDTETVSYASPQALPVAGGAMNASLTGTLRYTVTGADVGGGDFTVDIATVIIRRMVMADYEKFNPKTNSWEQSPMNGVVFANQRYGHTSTLMPNNDILYYGGRSCTAGTCANRPASLTVGIFLLTSERNWSLPATAIGERRALHTSTLLPDGTILAAGGTNGPSILRSADTFNPVTETFTPVANPMRHVRDLHSATLLPNGRVLIAGGFTTNAVSTGSTNTAEIYYPDTRVFIETTPMISSRSNHTAIMLPDGRVFVAGGFGTNSALQNDVTSDTAEIYMSTNGRWMAAANMPGGCERAVHATVQFKDGRIAMFGGINASGVLDTTAVYTPATNSWSCASVAVMPTPLRSHSATLLFDGRVLVAGGNDGLGEANKAFIYDPRSNTWTATDALPLLQPRFSHTATLLPNGNVMISGGSQKFGDVPESVEVFHVNASSWVTFSGVDGGFIAGARAFHTMTLALNNKLYAIGGSDGLVGGVGVSLYTNVEAGDFTASPDLFSKDAPPSFRQAAITATSATPFLPGTNLTVTGTQFRGGTEAGGGGAAQNSAFSFPHMILQQIDGSGGGASQSNGGFIVDLTTEIYQVAGNLATLDTSVTVALPPTSSSMPFGWYALRMGANDLYSNGRLVQAGPAKPATAPLNLLGAAFSTTQMDWSWTAIGGVDGYNVYNATTGVWIASVPVSGAPSYRQANLAPSATVSVIVAGFTLSGDGPATNSATTYTLPAVPASPTISNVTFEDLLLTWSANGNTSPATVYEVTQSSDDFVTDTSTPVPQIFNLSDNFVTIENLSANTTYYFRVRAFNNIGIPSAYSVSVTTRTRAPVTQPVASGRTTTSIDWTWSDPGGVTNYRVYNATNNVLLGTPALNSFTEVNLGTNTEHSIRVSAVTSAGEGPLSPPASAYTMAATPGTFNPPISGLTTASFLVNWSNTGPNPFATGHQVYISAFNNDGSLISQTTVPAGHGVYSVGVGGLTPAALYGYAIVAMNADDVPIPSDTPPVVVGTTWTLPAAPNPLSVLGTSPTSISVTWATNNNSSSATYQVTYSSNNFLINIATAVSFADKFGGNTAVITGLVTSSTYSVRVIASNPFGQLSQFSNSVTTQTFNGGAPPGSLAGDILRDSNSELSGSIGNGRSVLVRAPAQTFSSDVRVTISSFTPPAVLCPGATSIAFSIVNDPGLQPIGSLYFSFSFLPAELGTIPASRALLLRYDPVSGACVPLETSVDAANGWMTARINHFSLFQVGTVPLSTTAETARVFPNPYYAARDGYVTIDNVPPLARVRIFTLRGEPVLDVKANSAGLLTWSGTNGHGRSVASGVYLVMVESGGSKKILKLAVIR